MAETPEHSVLACIDGSIYAQSVADHAAWAAGRLSAGVRLLQVLGRRESSSSDRSGRIVAGARRQLLEQLSELDHARAKLLQSQARLDLSDAEVRLRDAGVERVDKLLRQGDLLETLQALEDETSLIVIGKRGAAADFATGHLGSNLERILRAMHRPVLIAARGYGAPSRVVIAFDGRASAINAVDEVARSALFQGLAITLVQCGTPDQASATRLAAAAEQLAGGGLKTEQRIESGPPETTLPAIVEETGTDLVVMGAYGHSRLRTLMIGSTTTQVIRDCKVPILVYR
ncbi:MAG: universal stress protein [Pseudomonadota bacterium]